MLYNVCFLKWERSSKQILADTENVDKTVSCLLRPGLNKCNKNVMKSAEDIKMLNSHFIFLLNFLFRQQSIVLSSNLFSKDCIDRDFALTIFSPISNKSYFLDILLPLFSFLNRFHFWSDSVVILFDRQNSSYAKSNVNSIYIYFNQYRAGE